MEIKSTPAYYRRSCFEDLGSKGILDMTPDIVRFRPKSKRIPEIVIPIDSIVQVRCNEEGPNLAGRLTKFSRQVGTVLGGSSFLAMQPMWIDTITGDQIELSVPRPLEWRDAIIEASNAFMTHFFSSLKDRTENYIATKRYSDAKAMLKDVLDKLSDPVNMAWAYACLCKVHFASGNDDKGGEAFQRAQALLDKAEETTAALELSEEARRNSSRVVEAIRTFLQEEGGRALSAAVDRAADEVSREFSAKWAGDGTSNEQDTSAQTKGEEQRTAETRLAELAQLKQRGLISDEEYAKRRETILDQI